MLRRASAGLICVRRRLLPTLRWRHGLDAAGDRRPGDRGASGRWTGGSRAAGAARPRPRPRRGVARTPRRHPVGAAGHGRGRRRHRRVAADRRRLGAGGTVRHARGVDAPRRRTAHPRAHSASGGPPRECDPAPAARGGAAPGHRTREHHHAAPGPHRHPRHHRARARRRDAARLRVEHEPRAEDAGGGDHPPRRSHRLGRRRPGAGAPLRGAAERRGIPSGSAAPRAS